MTDQDMFASDLVPHPPQDFLGKIGLDLALRSGYFLLQLTDWMLEICVLLAGVRVHEHC